MALITMTRQTVTRYLKRATLLELRARRDLGLAPSAELKSADLVAWAIALRPALSKSTWRQYKAALRCSLARQAVPSNDDALAQLERTGTDTCKRVTRNTSSQKAKAIKAADFRAIRDHLLARNGKWARATAVWLAAGTVTGLRPSEWLGTSLRDGPGRTRALLVPNSKATNGRANGISRSLDLTNLEPGLLALVKRHLEFVGRFSSQDDFHRARLGCRKTLYTATRQLWPKREIYVCLYSARHQFSADAKSGGLSRAEVAALMGHASDATATTHYARRTSGQSGFRIRPIATEVARVRRKAESRAEYIARKARESTPASSSQPTR